MINILFLSMICWLITYTLIELAGPYDIFKQLRDKVVDNKLSPLYCFYCTSIWVALPLSFLTDKWLYYWLVIATGAIFIHLIHERLDS